MVTDEERREIARALRETRRRMDKQKPPSSTGEAAFVYVQTLGRCVGLQPSNPNLYTRIAELVDRPVTRNETGTRGAFKCARCGFATILLDPRYCPRCGAMVV